MFTLSRRGEFFAIPKGCFHCGIDDNARRFNYEYFITSHEDGLDEKGFVLDNLRPQAYLDSIGEFQESCELLVQKTAYAFAQWCKKPHKVVVRIQPFNGAWVEFEFVCNPEALKGSGEPE